MSKPGRRRTAAEKPTQQPVLQPAPSAAWTPDRWILVWLCIALLGTACVLDPFADGGFDAPKRVIATVAAVAAAVAWALHGSLPDVRAWSRSGKAIAALMLLVALGLLNASWQSPSASAWSPLRRMGLFALYLVLGAAPALDGDRRITLLRVAAIAVAINALMSMLQTFEVKFPIPVSQISGRFPTGALLGNEGYVALACTLMAAALLPVLLQPDGGKRPWKALGVLLLCVATIGANRQLTSGIALAVAFVVVIAVHLRIPKLIWIGAALLACVLVSALVPTLREQTWARLPLNAHDYQTATTYRVGAWAAAIEMAEERPLSGHGPGSFALVGQEYRQRAEIRYHARLTPPFTANAFTFAHQDYLQLAADAGIPTVGAIIAALLMLIAGLLRRIGTADQLEATVLLGIISAGAIAALAWFPMQVPFTAILLLLASGRAWRLIAYARVTP